MTPRAIAALFVFLLFAQQSAEGRSAGIPLRTYLSLTDVAWISTSPDGSRIAYTSEQSGSSQLWVADADGSHPRQLTNGADSVHGAWWIPEDLHTILYIMSHGGSGVDQCYTIRDDRAVPSRCFPTKRALRTSSVHSRPTAPK